VDPRRNAAELQDIHVDRPKDPEGCSTDQAGDPQGGHFHCQGKHLWPASALQDVVETAGTNLSSTRRRHCVRGVDCVSRPSSAASSSLASFRSTATIVVAPDGIRRHYRGEADRTGADTATDSPAFTRSEFSTAPAPVCNPHPRVLRVPAARPVAIRTVFRSESGRTGRMTTTEEMTVDTGVRIGVAAVKPAACERPARKDRAIGRCRGRPTYHSGRTTGR